MLGTNGKTSTTRMIAAILQRHGLRTAAYTSPHLVSYRERVQLAERELERRAVRRVRSPARRGPRERVNRTLAGDDHVTQFELLTAAALWEMAEQGAQVAVVEAGLGGRYDATSVIDAELTVLTNVGLEHTRWLGPTLRDIAEEKLAVVRSGGTLVLGAGLAAQALEVAERVAGERGARIVVADGDGDGAGFGGEGRPLAARGAFQQRNFALARLAAETYLRGAGLEPDERAVREAAAATAVRGRLQVVSRRPADSARRRAQPRRRARRSCESLPALVGERPLALVLGVLEDKDAASMLGSLLGASASARGSRRRRAGARCRRPRCSRSRASSASSRSPASRAPRRRSPRRRRGRGSGQGVLATGSVYLVGELLAALQQAGAGQDSRAPRRRAAR